MLDAPISPFVAEDLRKAGHDAVHVRDYGMQTARDEEVFDRAATERRVLISADTDFGAILAKGGGTRPSLILFRGRRYRRPTGQAFLLLANLERLEKQLAQGCIVVLEASRVRIRPLPLAE